MIIARTFIAFAKPAIVAGAVGASAVGGWFAIGKLDPHGNVSPFQQVQGHGQRLLISEFGDKTDTIVAVDPNDVAGARTQIATVDHAPGFGVFPVLAHDGKAIAYTALPPGAIKPGPASPAEAAIVDVGGETHALADDVDLLVPPIWSPDDQSIVVRKNTAPRDGSDGAGSFELLLLGRDGSRSTITSWQSASVFPISYSNDGAKIYFATLNNTGADLYSVAPNGSGETKIAHLSDEIARDWRLSPDGATIAYSVATSGASPAVITKTLALDSGNATEAVAADQLEAGPPSTGIARGELNPTWRPGGQLTIGALKLDGGGDALTIDGAGATSRVTTNTDGIDLPLAWAPDETSLAVRALDGRTPFDASTSHVDLVRNGNRERVSENADVLIVGWLK